MTLRTVVFPLACLIACGRVFALGIRLADQDAAATARGNAFAATADNPSAIYYNPAGLTQFTGHQLRAGAYGITYQSRYSGAGRQFESEREWAALPQFYYSYTAESRLWAVGVGAYEPYGLSLEWPQASSFRTIVEKGQITYGTINPVFAWRATDTLSLAAGPTFNWADAQLRRSVGAPAYFAFEGDGGAVGFNAGVLWHAHPQHAFGASYRSATKPRFEGSSGVFNPNLANWESEAAFQFPQHVVVGWSFRPTPLWNLEFNVDWTGWDALNTVALERVGAPEVPLVFNWESSFFYEWGVTRKFSEGWHASAGYIYSENSVPDASFSPMVPDSNRHIFSLGAGREYDGWRWDFAYQFAYGPPRTVQNSPPGFETADGTYRFLSHGLALSLGYKF